MSKYIINPLTGKLDRVVDSVALTQNVTQAAQGGYEFTGGFTDRVFGQSGANDIGNDVEYTSAMVLTSQWLRFGFDSTRQLANDKPYWSRSSDVEEAPGAIYGADAGNLPGDYSMDGSNAYPDAYQGTGLFSGTYMPAEVTSMFNFTDNVTVQPDTNPGFNAASTSGDLQYNAATGSYNMSECKFVKVYLIPFKVDLLWSPVEAQHFIILFFELRVLDFVVPLNIDWLVEEHSAFEVRFFGFLKNCHLYIVSPNEWFVHLNCARITFFFVGLWTIIFRS